MAKATVPNRQFQTEPRVRRAYFECRYGQLHVHNAIPPGGGFEEGTSLLCVHPIPGSARTFERFLAFAGRDRSVYAPDVPGCGESDTPPSRPSVAEYAAALGDFLDSMRFRQIDVLGYQSGTFLAAELAISRPQQIRRLVLASVPVLSDLERETLRRPSWPEQDQDGSHLASEWRRLLGACGPGASVQIAARLFTDKLRSAVNANAALEAAQRYSVRERFPLVTQPTLVLRLKDDFWEITPRIRESMPKARMMELPEHGIAAFDAAAATVMAVLREFLRG